MTSKTSISFIPTLWYAIASNFNFYTKIKPIAAILLIFLMTISCTKEDASTDQCDAQIEQLSNALIDKSNAFAASQSVTNCQAYRTAYLNLYNKMNQCGYSTASLDSDYDFVQGLDCGNFDGGNFDGGSGGGNFTGTAMIWSQIDHGCGSISVTINGSTQVVSSYYSSGAPSCGANGCANFTLPPGTYSVSASCSSSSWSGTITVTSGGCSKLRLDS